MSDERRVSATSSQFLPPVPNTSPAASSPPFADPPLKSAEPASESVLRLSSVASVESSTETRSFVEPRPERERFDDGSSVHLTWAPGANLERRRSHESIYSLNPRRDEFVYLPHGNKHRSSDLRTKRDREESAALVYNEMLGLGRSIEQAHAAAEAEKLSGIRADQLARERRRRDARRRTSQESRYSRSRSQGSVGSSRAAKPQNSPSRASLRPQPMSLAGSSALPPLHEHQDLSDDGRKILAASKHKDTLATRSTPPLKVNAPAHHKRLADRRAEMLERGRSRSRTPAGTMPVRYVPSVPLRRERRRLKDDEAHPAPSLASVSILNLDGRPVPPRTKSSSSSPPMNGGKSPLVPSSQHSKGRLYGSNAQPDVLTRRREGSKHSRLRKKRKAGVRAPSPRVDESKVVEMTLSSKQSRRTRLRKHVSSGFRKLGRLPKVMYSDAQRSREHTKMRRRSQNWTISDEA